MFNILKCSSVHIKLDETGPVKYEHTYYKEVSYVIHYVKNFSKFSNKKPV